MPNQIKEAVANIFKDYEDTPELRDFKEEITVNLNERISEMKNKGISEADAVKKAIDELGDITEAADAVSRQKRNEIIGSAYAKAVPLDKTHSIGYTVSGVVFLFGLITALSRGLGFGEISSAIAAFMPFFVASVGGFVYLGLTQETRASYPLSKKRALWYTLSSVMIAFGACACGTMLFRGATFGELGSQGLINFKMDAIVKYPAVLRALIPFVLPGFALLAFLILTEKNRRKPWVMEIDRRRMEKESEIYDEKFGLLSGALWIFAVAVFVLLGFTISFRISWIVFLFAISLQLVLQYFTVRNSGK